MDQWLSIAHTRGVQQDDTAAYDRVTQGAAAAAVLL